MIHRTTGIDGDDAAAVVLTGDPVTIPDSLRPITFADMRTAAADGSFPGLWEGLHPRLRVPAARLLSPRNG